MGKVEETYGLLGFETKLGHGYRRVDVKHRGIEGLREVHKMPVDYHKAVGHRDGSNLAMIPIQ